jgi:hypothetical protein
VLPVFQGILLGFNG